ncbi:hypothetical protein SAMN04489740_2546 [Arthrobacter alpinus]|uniref:Uncharacterized protein n=1 Tax=Arthrobacter alpinus TaxID=656366 RepID=A0A1H5LPE8_9MICC|nr:hypothetical protein [Arthrobacter alpinus]SEE78955.1 hypothetical protein SAMN04489740_2546 [Arthrobacter alpinus]
MGKHGVTQGRITSNCGPDSMLPGRHPTRLTAKKKHPDPKTEV